MRIAQVTYNLESGGGQRITVDLCNELAKNPNNEVWLIVLEYKENNPRMLYLNDVSDNVKVKFVGAKSGHALKAFIGLVKAIKEIKPDVVHAQVCDNALLFMPALMFRKTKFLSTFHSTVKRTIAFKPLKMIYRWMFDCGRIVPCTISPLCKQSYIDYFGNDKSVLVLNGRCEGLLTDRHENVQNEIEDYKKSPEDVVFIYIGRIHPVKNPEMLYETFSRLERENVNFQLIVLGSGHKEKYSRYSSERIHILGEKNNVTDYLDCSDFITLSSHIEGMPIVFLEAMSRGVIPVSTPAGGIPDIIHDGVNGFLSADTEDREAYYETVKRAMVNKDSISRESLILEFQEKYSMEVCAANYSRLYAKGQ